MDTIVEEIRANGDRKFIAEARGLIIDCAKHINSNDKTFNVTTLPEHKQELNKAMNNYIDYAHLVEASEKAYLAVLEKLNVIEEGEDEEFIEDDAYIDEFNTLVDQEKEALINSEMDAIEELDTLVNPPKPQEARTENRGAQVLKDPITKLDIKVPVQSKKCKHVYEKETIEAYLVNSKKCPQAGCTNKRMTERELIPFDIQESSPIIIS